MQDTAPIVEFTDPRAGALARALSDAGILIDRVRFARIALAAYDTRTQGADLAEQIAANLTAHDVRFDVQKISRVCAEALT